MKLPLYLLAAASLLTTTQANAQVYKCTFADETTRQNKVVYTDAPCAKTSKQTVTVIQVKSNLPAPIAVNKTDQLDTAVTSAVLKRDFKLAKSLASTKEHWRLIAIAEGEAPQPIIVANSQPEVTRADECAQAKNAFDYVSRNEWRHKDLVSAKKSLMHVACGVPEPINNQPIFVGQRFGGFQSGRLIYPNAGFSYYTPHAHRPQHAQQPYTYTNRFGQQTGFSLGYTSRSFGFSTGGFIAR